MHEQHKVSDCFVYMLVITFANFQKPLVYLDKWTTLVSSRTQSLWVFKCLRVFFLRPQCSCRHSTAPWKPLILNSAILMFCQAFSMTQTPKQNIWCAKGLDDVVHFTLRELFASGQILYGCVQGSSKQCTCVGAAYLCCHLGSESSAERAAVNSPAWAQSAVA